MIMKKRFQQRKMRMTRMRIMSWKKILLMRMRTSVKGQMQLLREGSLDPSPGENLCQFMLMGKLPKESANIVAL